MPRKIFISYRRGDEPGFAHALYARLEQAFSAEDLFMDVEGGIAAGADFAQVLQAKVARGDVVLALIGVGWLTAADEYGQRRLDNPDDFVRIEIESAMRLGKRVIPVLINKAEMPRASDLPEPLQPLARRNAVRLTHERFKADTQGLISAIQQVAEETPGLETEEEEAKKREQGRVAALAALSPEQIAKAEELNNWEVIRSSKNPQDFRDHFARFVGGTTEGFARARLEELLWRRLGRYPTFEGFNRFLAEFPQGIHAQEAADRRAALTRETRKRRWAVARERFGVWFGLILLSGLIGGPTALLVLLSSPGPSEAPVSSKDASTFLVRTFAGHSGLVNSVAFSPDGRTALSGSSDKTLKLWDVATGNELRTFTGHSGWVTSVAFSPDGLTALSGSNDNTVKLWDLTTGKLLRTFIGRSTVGVTSVAFSPDGHTVLSGAWGGKVRLQEIATGKGLFDIAGDDVGVLSVAFSPDGKTVLYSTSGSSSAQPPTNGTIKLCTIVKRNTCMNPSIFKGHTGSVSSVAFSPDGRTVLSGADDKTVRLWEATTGKELHTFTEDTSAVRSVAFTPDNRVALSGDLGGTLRTWEIETGKELRVFEDKRIISNVFSVAVSPDGHAALSGHSDSTLRLWDLTGLP